ncbi:MAG: SpoVR family protein [Chloroflexi bacterium]|nr:SpoVR family protein [Chloroflexota bacterium]
MMSDERVRLEEALVVLGDTARNLGLRPPEIRFAVVPAEIMYEVAAYHFPTRFPHWTHGAQYHRQKTRYDYGLEKIYELVLNTEPCTAYLLETNSLIEQKLVVAHVLAHADFFRRNIYYKETNRQMHDTTRLHAEFVQRCEEEQGVEAVEQTLDAALSIAVHVDPAAGVFRRKTAAEYEQERLQPPEEPVSAYDDIWHLTGKMRKQASRQRRIPAEPERDLLRFLAEASPQLEEWQRAILHLVRAEWLYFYPNLRTRVMNEGYAVFWHERILERGLLDPDEHVCFRRLHANVVAQGHRFAINPYLVGYKLWRDIERRWEEPGEERTWYGAPINRKGGEGLAKVFAVAAEYRDADFVRAFLTEKLVEELDLYGYAFEGDAKRKVGRWVVQRADWQQVRDVLAEELTSLGIPAIMVMDGDYHHQGELYLAHDCESDRRPLDLDYAQRTLVHVHRLWGRPVHLETRINGNALVLSYDGKSATQSTT